MSEKLPFSYKYPHPAVTVDLAIFTLRENSLHVLLIERGREPFKGSWALPGGFVRKDEDLISAATRELEEETGVVGSYLEQVGAFGQPNRDPREWVISIAFCSIISSDNLHLRSGGDAASAGWWPLDKLPKVAFDHAEILETARRSIRDKLRGTAIALRFLSPEFTLTELQHVHEALLGHELDKRNFRKWVSSLSYIHPTGRMRRGGQHRPAELYRGEAAAISEVTDPASEPSSRITPSTLQNAYRRGYEDAAREFAATFDSAQRNLLKRVRSA